MPPDVDLVPWDSAYFSLRIGRLCPEQPSEDAVARAVHWRNMEAIDVLYALVNPASGESLRALERHAFNLVDIRVEMLLPFFEAATSPFQKNLPYPVSKASWGDRGALCKIALESHRGGRYLDEPRFPEPARTSIYETWIRNSCKGWADSVWVCNVEGVPAGYLTCHQAEKRGQIGLVGVSPSFQGRGVGHALMQRGLQWFAENGATSIEVVAQGANTGAIRFYEKHGFRTHRIRLWYHGWRQ